MSGPRRDPLLARFSLYGFLKNQQYYEPFFLLVLQAKGLSFLQIGLLFSFREFFINVFGIPAGFLSDLHGRRATLVICFAAYIVAFLGFGLGTSLPALFGAMLAFSIGESFRSGAHKAMIFQHLRDHGRESEKSVVYGITRSWSKIGSAVSAVASGFLMIVASVPAHVFLYSIPPYLLGMVNVATYPKSLEGERGPGSVSPREMFRTMARETRAALAHPGLRRLFLESAALQAMAKTVRDYVQPLVVLALSAPLIAGAFRGFADLDPVKRSALVIAAIYVVMNLVAAFGSRQSHRLRPLDRTRLPWLWIAVTAVAALLTLGLTARDRLPWMTGVAVAGFLLLVLLENLWRPLFLDRLDEVSDSKYGAAILSVEAQVQSLGVMILAPVIGWSVDRFGLAAAGFAALALALAAGAYSALARRRETFPTIS